MRLAERASDFIDRLTFDRLADGLPSDDRQQKRIKKAVCAVAEMLYQIDVAEKNALSAANGTSVSIPGGGTATLYRLAANPKLTPLLSKWEQAPKNGARHIPRLEMYRKQMICS